MKTTLTSTKTPVKENDDLHRCDIKRGDGGHGWIIYLVATGQPVDGYYLHEATARDMAKWWSSKPCRKSLRERLRTCRFERFPDGNLALHWSDEDGSNEE